MLVDLKTKTFRRTWFATPREDDYDDDDDLDDCDDDDGDADDDDDDLDEGARDTDTADVMNVNNNGTICMDLNVTY